MNDRNQILDIAKGMLIILVVLGHSIQFGFGNLYFNTEQFYDNLLFRFIYTFHMPLFMLISGYLFYFTNKKPYKKVVISRLISIGIPYIVFCNLLYIISYNLNNRTHFYFSHYLLSFKGNMWFLSSILLNCIIVASVIHCFKRNILGYIILWLLIPLSFIIPDSYITPMHNYMYSYFIIGFFINRYSIKFPHLFWNKWFFVLLTCLTIICSIHYGKSLFIYKTGFCVYENGTIDDDKLYINILRYIIGGGISCWFLITVFFIKTHIKKLAPFFINIGKETLGIYGFQSIIFMILSTIMTIKNINISINIMSLLICIITLFLCEIALMLCNLNNYTKLFFLGKRKK